MSWASPYPLSRPPQPSRRRHRKLSLLPALALVLAAVPTGTYGFSSYALSQGQALEAEGKYADALGRYAAVQVVAGNPAARPLTGQIADQARAAAVQTHTEWGQQAERRGRFAEAEVQYQAAAASGLAVWQARANAALANLYLAWGDALASDHHYGEAIARYRQVVAGDLAGAPKAQTANALAAAYAGYALSFMQAQPPDYLSAVAWYQTLLKEFPNNPRAQEAAGGPLPQALFLAGTAYLQDMRYAAARDTLGQLVKDYSGSAWTARANAALAAPQKFSGRLMTGDGTPVPNRLMRIATQWKIVAAHTYDDAGGQHYSTTTDASGNFAIDLPPGQNYLVTWWDPSRSNFVTTFISDTVPVNQITIDPLEPKQKDVAIS